MSMRHSTDPFASKLAPTNTPYHSRASSLPRAHTIIREQARSHKYTLSFASKLAPTTTTDRPGGGPPTTANGSSARGRASYNSNLNCQLTLAPRLVQGFLHRGKKVLQHGTRTEVDFGVDLHARRKSITLSLSLHERLRQFDQGAEAGSRLILDAGIPCVLLVPRLARVGTDVPDASVHHSVLLERIRGEFQPGGLPGLDQPGIEMRHPHFRQQPIAIRHQRHRHRAGCNHAAERVRGEVFHYPCLLYTSPSPRD